MKQFKYQPLWVGVIYFLILLSIALWVRDIPNQQDAFNTIQQLIGTSTMGDPASFATAAIDIAENGWISSANEWILNLWPPGFILLEALIIKVFGPDAPVILVLQILAAALFSVVLLLLYDLLSTCVKIRFAFILPLLIFAFPVSRVFLLEPTGVTLGENFAIGFFLLCILLASLAVGRNSLRYAAYAGLCLALSAYFRSQFEIILLALTGWGVLLIIAIKLTRLRNSIEPELVKSVVKTMVVALLVAHAATAPWRAYHWVHQGVPVWVSTALVTFGNSVMTSEYLESKHGGFVVEGAGNLVCRIDPATCGDSANATKLFIKTFITHPVEWYSLKFDVIGKYWFSSVQNWTSVKFKSTSMDIAMNGLLLIALIALAALLFTKKVRYHGLWILLVWFNASLFSSYFLIFTVQQFEVRYFYFPKIAGMVMMLIVASLYYRSMKKIDIVDN
jgi:hypothetical protein